MAEFDTPRPSLVDLAHQAVAAALEAGDIVVDATAGNGHDTAFLARAVDTVRHVYAFDVQQQALSNTRARLAESGLEAQVSLIHGGHEELAQHLPPECHKRIGAIMFNLGYLPGADKSLTTQTESTLAALEQAVTLLRPGGVITVLGYTGHPGGKEEAAAVADFAARCPPSLTICRQGGPPPVPELTILQLSRH